MLIKNKYNRRPQQPCQEDSLSDELLTENSWGRNFWAGQLASPNVA